MRNLNTHSPSVDYIDANCQRSAGVAAEIWTITPTVAQHILDKHHKKNRDLNASSVNSLRAAMAAKRWRMTGDPIKFGEDGYLKDGQHRLTAIARGSTSITTVVVLGLPNDAFDAMDTGRGRKPADIFKLDGVPWYQVTASAANWLKRLSSGRPMFDRSSETGQVLLKRYREEWPTLDLSVLPAKKAKEGIGLSWPMLTALHYLFAQKDAEKADQFFEELANPNSADLAYLHTALSERRKAAAGIGRLRDTDMALTLVRSWNNYVTGKGAPSFIKATVACKGPNEAQGRIDKVSWFHWPGVYPRPTQGLAPRYEPPTQDEEEEAA